MTEPAWTPERFSSPEEQTRWFKKVQKTVAVDFDGVLHPYTAGWCGPVPADEPPMPGAAWFLRELQRRGYEVKVFSTRCEITEGKDGIVAWLQKHDLIDYVSEITNTKPPAVAYVDDRAVEFRNGNWDSCLDEIARLDGHRIHGAAQ